MLKAQAGTEINICDTGGDSEQAQRGAMLVRDGRESSSRRERAERTRRRALCCTDEANDERLVMR